MPAIVAERLERAFGEVLAVQGIDIAVEEGEIFGFLGPNGAGKTTTVRMLTTLLLPTGGSASVAGHDVRSEARSVRASIGVALQEAALDPLMTGRELIRLQATLQGIPTAEGRRRADDLLERVGLGYAADRRVGTYSGGMQRRLDLAAALVHEPRVLFLDEPTTGLDPRSRIDLWETIEGRVAEGTTVLLTTQYLDEADRLADRIAVIDHGQVIAEGSSDELKDQVGGERLDITLESKDEAEKAIAALAPIAGETPAMSDGLLRMPVRERKGAIAEAVRRLNEAGVGIDDVAMSRPTLDDVFLTLTGHAAEEADGEESGEEER